jgi:hypothetical protein
MRSPLASTSFSKPTDATHPRTSSDFPATGIFVLALPLLKQRILQGHGSGMTFQKGVSGNPKGRALGARNKATQMVDKLLFANVKEIAEVLVREAKAGQHWAVKASLHGMLPSRARRIAEPIDIKPPATVQEASEQIGMLITKVAQGEIDVDAGQVLIEGLRGYIEARKTSELEMRAEEMAQELAALRAQIEGGQR